LIPKTVHAWMKRQDWSPLLAPLACSIEVKRIPMPPKWGNDWHSYTNIIMANGVLLMPSFSDVDFVLEDQAVEVNRFLLPPVWK